MTVGDIYQILDRIAPFDTQADFDNSGLLIGSPAWEVSGVLFALDVTEAVVEEAVALGANLIVTHHPVLFSPVQRITEDQPEGRLIAALIRNRLSLIAAHTNLDQAPGGINDTLAALCGLSDVTGEGYVRIGNLPEACSARELADHLSGILQCTVRLMGPEEAVIDRLAVSSGAGGSEWKAGADAGCSAFLSGEIKHHHALSLAACGIVSLECGHYATEAPGIRTLALALQNALDEIEWRMRVFVSKIPAYSFP